MAWDALGSLFQKKDKDEDASKAVGVSRGIQSSAPAAPAASQASWTGEGGSAGGPVRSGFVNFGTLFDLNKQGAGSMAKGVYDKAQGAVEAARGKLQGARDTFKAQAGQGTAKGIIGGAHGTRIEDTTAKPAAPAQTTTAADEDRHFYEYDPSTDTSDAAIGPGSWFAKKDAQGKRVYSKDEQNNTGSVKNEADSGYRPDDPSTWGAGAPVKSGAPGANSAGVARTSQLLGASPSEEMGFRPGDDAQSTGMFDSLLQKPDESGLRDYHHTTNLLGAKSGAGQEYTGPDSLRESMGEDAYAQLANELQNAESGAEALTNSGGIANALGYGPDSGQGNSALDTGLTQVAGQSNFKNLADKTKGLKGGLAAAQKDSMKAAAGGKIQSDAAAADWDRLLKEYEAANAPKDETPQSTYPSNGNNFSAFDDQGNYNNGGKLLSDSGYTMSELEEIYGDLTPEERAWLNNTASTNFVTDALLAAEGKSGTNASIHENVLAKLAKHRASKKGQ